MGRAVRTTDPSPARRLASSAGGITLMKPQRFCPNQSLRPRHDRLAAVAVVQ